MAKPKKILLPPEFERLSLQIGGFIQHWGFKKIHGLIWSNIWLSQVPLDAQSLIDRLGVSKALVSITLKDLIEYNVIKEAGKSSRGTIVYEPNLNIIEVILNVVRRREKRMLSEIETSFRLLRDIDIDEKKKMELNQKRLKTLGKMVKEAQDTLNGILALNELQLHNWQEFNDSENTPCP